MTQQSNMTVAKLAERAEVAPHVVRLYARSGLLPSNTRSPSGYRLFNEDDLTRMRFIRVAQSLGFSLAEIGEIIHKSRHHRSPCPQVRETVSERLEEVQEELRYLRRIHKQMKDAIKTWEDMPDKVPSGNDVCHLIESVAAECELVTVPQRFGGILKKKSSHGHKM